MTVVDVSSSSTALICVAEKSVVWLMGDVASFFGRRFLFLMGRCADGRFVSPHQITEVHLVSSPIDLAPYQELL